MTVSGAIQIILLVLEIVCFCWAWKIPQPYGGDAGLGDALAKLLGYGVCGLLVLIVAIWFAIQHIVFR